MLSLTIQVPLNSTASQCMSQPCGGMMMTSPGTSFVVASSSYLSAPRHTVTTSLDCTVSCKLCWFCNVQDDRIIGKAYTKMWPAAPTSLHSSSHSLYPLSEQCYVAALVQYRLVQYHNVTECISIRDSLREKIIFSHSVSY